MIGSGGASKRREQSTESFITDNVTFGRAFLRPDGHIASIVIRTFDIVMVDIFFHDASQLIVMEEYGMIQAFVTC